MEGAKALIARHRPALYVENNNPQYGDELIRAVSTLGYTCYWFCSDRFSEHNFNVQPRKMGGFDANMLCVPAEQKFPAGQLPRVNEFADLARGIVPLVGMKAPTGAAQP